MEEYKHVGDLPDNGTEGQNTEKSDLYTIGGIRLQEMDNWQRKGEKWI